MHGFTDGDGPGNLFLGQRTGDGDLMRRCFRVGCGCFFLGGAGEGKRSSRARFAEKFSQNGGLQTAPFGVIYYMLSSGGFAAACLQAIVKGVHHGLHGAVGMIFYAHAVYVVICYMSIICYMPVICLVQSPPQEAVAVFGYIEGPFLVRTGHARERHAP